MYKKRILTVKTVETLYIKKGKKQREIFLQDILSHVNINHQSKI